MSCVDLLVEDATAPQACLNFLKKRKASRDQLDANTSVNDQFAELTTIGRLEMPFCIAEASKLTGLTRSEVLEAMKFEEQTPRHIIMAATGWSTKLVLPKEARAKKVLSDVIQKAHARSGNWLAGFKDNEGWLKPDGSINWKKAGLYHCEYAGDEDNSPLLQISYMRQDPVSVANTGVTRQWQLSCNFSAWEAVFKLAPHSTPVSFFFKDCKKGPFSRPKMSGNCAEFNAMLVEAYDAHMARVSAAGTAQEEEEVATELGKRERTKKLASLDAARAKAKASLAEKKARRTLTMTKSE